MKGKKSIFSRSNLRRLFLISFLFNAYSYASTSNDQVPMIGNFALPSSQQPGAFLSVGQNTLPKGTTQLYLAGIDIGGPQHHFADAIPGIVYGITNNLSIFFNAPVAVSYQYQSYHSAGLGDAYLQLEYTFYTKDTSKHLDTATLIANTSFPTGSDKKIPATGRGAQAFFLGGTFTRLYADWLIFGSPGVLASDAHHGNRVGNIYLYQFGLGRNISYATSQYIFSWLLELDGTYSEKNRVHGESDRNSGGNIIYATPSLWFSTQHLILQGGMGKPIVQSLNGHQFKNTYLMAFNVGWTF